MLWTGRDQNICKTELKYLAEAVSREEERRKREDEEKEEEREL